MKSRKKHIHIPQTKKRQIFYVFYLLYVFDYLLLIIISLYVFFASQTPADIERHVQTRGPRKSEDIGVNRVQVALLGTNLAQNDGPSLKILFQTWANKLTTKTKKHINKPDCVSLEL